MSERTLLAFSFAGRHVKSDVGRIDPAKHFLMLLAAMRRADPGNRYDKLVSAAGTLDESGAESLVDEVRNLATVVTTKGSPGHLAGASDAICTAIEWAAERGYHFMAFTADDILFWPDGAVERMVAPLRLSGAAYLGSHWGSSGINTKAGVNTQVFSCQPSELVVDGVCIFRGEHSQRLEDDVLWRLRQAGIPYLDCGPRHGYDYLHSHRPEVFLAAAAAMDASPVKWQALVVARSHEDLSWLTHPVFSSFRKYIYDASGDGQWLCLPGSTLARLPSGTRDDMEVYFRHLVTHYDALEEVVWFVSGNPFRKAPRLLELALGDVKTYLPLARRMVVSDATGRPHHPGLRVGECYEHVFGEPFPGKLTFPAGGMVAVNRDAIRSRPVAMYERALAWAKTPTGKWELERMMGKLWQ